jgi:membrane-bound lytic murein transglycosylase D
LADSRTTWTFIAGTLSGATVTVGIATVLVLAFDVDVRMGRGDDAVVAPVAETAAVQPDSAAEDEAPCPELKAEDPPWMPDADARAKALHLARPSKRLARRIGFWEKVWGEHRAHVYVFADKRRPSSVPAVVDCNELYRKDRDPNASEKRCDRRLIAKKKEIVRSLRKQRRRPSRSLRRALDNERRLYSTAYKNILVLQGKADKLDEAVARSAEHLDKIERIFITVGVPPELTRLSFVESLFQPDVKSHAGAVGAFQFMAATGRQWLMIGDGVDERLDPDRSAWAAAQYMKWLHGRFDDWALGLTAYNTGPTRMRRLVKRHRTRDIGTLADKRTEKAFGFDGQNYYASLHAVVNLTTSLDPIELPSDRQAVTLPEPMPLAEVARCTKVPQSTLARINPALEKEIQSGDRAVPKGYRVSLPTAEEAAQAAVSKDEGAGDQKKGEQPS